MEVITLTKKTVIINHRNTSFIRTVAFAGCKKGVQDPNFRIIIDNIVPKANTKAALRIDLLF